MTPDKNTLDALRIDRAKAIRRRSPVTVIAAAFGVVVAVAGAMWWLRRAQPIVVRTAMVREDSAGAETTLLNASGYVTARREATVSSKVTGMVMEVLVEEGMEVEAGRVLARIDASNVEKSLRLAEAQLESARRSLDETRANLVQAEREWHRLSRLAAEQVANQVEVDRAETVMKALQARLERQAADVDVGQREVALWRQQLEDTVIRAPFEGIVTSKNAQPGEMISPISAGGGFTRTGICTIVDMSSLEIEVDVSESYINRVKPGQPVEATLDAYPEWRIPARVIAIIPTADRQKATVKVRIGFEKLDPRVLPQMSVKAAFLGADHERTSSRTLILPRAGVFRRDGQDLVWLVRGGRVEQRAVTIGEPRGDEVAIFAGVSPGDRVVVEAPPELAEGVSVKETKP